MDPDDPPRQRKLRLPDGRIISRSDAHEEETVTYPLEPPATRDSDPRSWENTPPRTRRRLLAFIGGILVVVAITTMTFRLLNHTEHLTEANSGEVIHAPVGRVITVELPDQDWKFDAIEITSGLRTEPDPPVVFEANDAGAVAPKTGYQLLHIVKVTAPGRWMLSASCAHQCTSAPRSGHWSVTIDATD